MRTLIGLIVQVMGIMFIAKSVEYSNIEWGITITFVSVGTVLITLSYFLLHDYKKNENN